MHIGYQLSIVVDAEFPIEIVLVSFDRTLGDPEFVGDLLAEETLACEPADFQFPGSKLDCRKDGLRELADFLLELLLHILSGKHEKTVAVESLLDKDGILLFRQPGHPPVENNDKA